jgi:hypothetical protein
MAVRLGIGSNNSWQFAIVIRVPPSLPLSERMCMRDKAFSAAEPSEERAGTRPMFLYEGPDALPLLPLPQKRRVKMAEGVAHQRISLRAPMSARVLPSLAIAAGRGLPMTRRGDAAMMSTAIARRPDEVSVPVSVSEAHRDTRDISDSARATEAWEHALLALPKGNCEVEALRAASLRFLTTDWLRIALAADWDALQLWGCFPAARIDVVRRRGDNLGLVPALMLGRGCSIESIDRDRAVVSRANDWRPPLSPSRASGPAICVPLVGGPLRDAGAGSIRRLENWQ